MICKTHLQLICMSHEGLKRIIKVLQYFVIFDWYLLLVQVTKAKSYILILSTRNEKQTTERRIRTDKTLLDHVGVYRA